MVDEKEKNLKQEESQKAEVKEIAEPVKKEVEKNNESSKKESIKKEGEVKADVEKESEKKSQEKESLKQTHKVKKPVVKKDHAKVYGRALPISLKYSIAIGKFIRGKKVESAIEDLELVLKKKKVIPFEGEIAHKKGKRMMGGKYPVNASKEFIKLLKSLSANATFNGLDLDKAIIFEVIPNKAPEQRHRFGRTKFKRTHVSIISKEK